MNISFVSCDMCYLKVCGAAPCDCSCHDTWKAYRGFMDTFWELISEPYKH